MKHGGAYKDRNPRNVAVTLSTEWPSAYLVVRIDTTGLAWDDARQHGLSTLRLLLSPGLSERLVRGSTYEWSSSFALVCSAVARTLAKCAMQQRRRR